MVEFIELNGQKANVGAKKFIGHFGSQGITVWVPRLGLVCSSSINIALYIQYVRD
jgi:hypothetical protein